MTSRVRSVAGRRSGRSRRWLVVVLLVGASVAACAMPGLRHLVERTRAAAAFNYLASVQTAQKRQHGRLGRYATDLSRLDVRLEVPGCFSTGAVLPRRSPLADGWTLTLTRNQTLWGRGGYTVTFTEDGLDADPAHSSILAESAAIQPVEKASTLQWSP